jgi:hypothetical protein
MRIFFCILCDISAPKILCDISAPKNRKYKPE